MPKTSLTTTLIEDITEGVKAGEWPHRAAARHGVSPWQWKHWNDLGDRVSDSADASEPQEDLSHHELLCRTLVRRCDQAEAECEQRWLKNWLTTAAAARGNGWTAFATLLERRFPTRWSKRPQEAGSPPGESLEEALERIHRDQDSD